MHPQNDGEFGRCGAADVGNQSQQLRIGRLSAKPRKVLALLVLLEVGEHDPS